MESLAFVVEHCKIFPWGKQCSMGFVSTHCKVLLNIHAFYFYLNLYSWIISCILRFCHICLLFIYCKLFESNFKSLTQHWSCFALVIVRDCQLSSSFLQLLSKITRIIVNTWNHGISLSWVLSQNDHLPFSVHRKGKQEKKTSSMSRNN